MARKKVEIDEVVEPKAKGFDFFNKIKTGNVAADTGIKVETKEWIDMGCYSLNAIVSGDIYKGFPNNRILMAAGEEQVGKTYIAIHAFCKPLLDAGYFIYYIDTEGSVTEEQLIKAGLKKGQFKIIAEEVVEEVRFTLTAILNTLEASMEDGVNNNKCAFVLDSQGQLDTLKSRSDSTNREVKQDLTLQKELKKMYKNVTGRMAKMDIPFFITNHIYVDNMSFIPKTHVSGGQGGLYAASVILHLRKKQFKEGEVRVGTIVTAKIYKNRFCREGKQASFYLNFEKGLNKYYGLHEFADEANLIEKWDRVKFEKKGVVSPEKAGNQKFYVIKDPKIPCEKWIVCKEGELHKKNTIGTILDEINVWVNENFKLITPIDFEYGDENPEAKQDSEDTTLDDLDELE
jgi:RecA/RadA recombinase